MDSNKHEYWNKRIAWKKWQNNKQQEVICRKFMFKFSISNFIPLTLLSLSKTKV